MNRYQLIAELGQGGMGVVYRAQDTQLNREVAIKFLLANPGDLDETERARFRREMDVLMGLSHPGIVKVLDAGVQDGRLFYVMELLSACDLRVMLRQRGPLP